VNAKFIQVDGGEAAIEAMKDDIFDFFCENDTVQSIRLLSIPELGELKIVFFPGGFPKLLKFIAMHPEIKRCQFNPANCSTYINKQDDDEMGDFLHQIIERGLGI
jgi:hypothetical protein